MTRLGHARGNIPGPLSKTGSRLGTCQLLFERPVGVRGSEYAELRNMEFVRFPHARRVSR